MAKFIFGGRYAGLLGNRFAKLLPKNSARFNLPGVASLANATARGVGEFGSTKGMNLLHQALGNKKVLALTMLPFIAREWMRGGHRSGKPAFDDLMAAQQTLNRPAGT